MKKSLLVVLCLSAGSGLLTGQTIKLPTATRPAVPSFSLGLKANEAIRAFEVAVENDDEKPVQVYGAQTTAGLYVVDYPKVIPPKGNGTVKLLYLAKQDSTETVDVVRLLTDAGEKSVQVKHDREPVTHFDVTSLQWSLNETPSAKSVTLTVAPGTAVPRSVKMIGRGATANLEAIGGNQYRISVTPSATDKPRQFPVSIQFAPAFPGIPNVISCAVVVTD